MKVVKNCELVLNEKQFTTEKGEVVNYIESVIKLPNGLSLKVTASKQDKKVVKYIHQEK
jgi:hypothetical protein